MTANLSECQQGGSDHIIATTDPELLFLIIHALSTGPLAAIGQILAREAEQKGLLPHRYDIHGNWVSADNA